MDIIGNGLVIGLAVGAIIGFIIVLLFLKRGNQRKIEEMNAKADLVVKEARLTAKRITDESELNAEKIMSKAESKHESIKQKKIQEAKQRFSRMKGEFESEKAQHKVDLKDREVGVVKMENELKQRQDKFQGKLDDLANQRSDIENLEIETKTIRENLEKQMRIVAKKKEELDAANEKHIKALETVAKISEAEAKEQLLEAVKGKAENDAMALIKNTLEQAKVTANKDAKKIVIQTIQRMCAEYTIENTVSVFNLESDDLKGQIIGREGRNIRALEAATGAEIVVDDTPEAIVISSFDPIRREV